MSSTVMEQGVLDIFESPYKRASLLGTFGLTYCGCCGRTVEGYDAINGGHNACHGRNPRGLGCECMPMSLTLNHVHYHLRELGFPSEYTRSNKCWCEGNPALVNGSAKRGHPNTADHQADKLVHYWIPRAFRCWPESRHDALAKYINAMARYWGAADLIAGDA